MGKSVAVHYLAWIGKHHDLSASQRNAVIEPGCLAAANGIQHKLDPRVIAMLVEDACGSVP
jgi:hypothetical protein